MTAELLARTLTRALDLVALRVDASAHGFGAATGDLRVPQRSGDLGIEALELEPGALLEALELLAGHPDFHDVAVIVAHPQGESPAVAKALVEAHATAVHLGRHH